MLATQTIERYIHLLKVACFKDPNNKMTGRQLENELYVFGPQR
jgi:hypothetical protein